MPNCTKEVHACIGFDVQLERSKPKLTQYVILHFYAPEYKMKKKLIRSF